MRIIRNLKEIKKPIKDAVLTIGVFDGVHLGHRRIIETVVEHARRTGSKSIVLTFEPHPSKLLGSKTCAPTLISLEHRIRLIGSLGADYLVVSDFTKEIARLSPEGFVKKVLFDKFVLKEVCVGENFYFGRGGTASSEELKRLGKRYGFGVRVVKILKRGASAVSSSLIRALVLDGSISKASRLLGRPVSILGTVVRGSSRGRILGFPTANVNPHHEVVPPAGVYAVMVKFNEAIFKGVLNIGSRPTFYSRTHDMEPTIEVHIFGFRRDIYGEDLEIFFVKRIRSESRFRDRIELIEQIKKDSVRAAAILSRKKALQI